MGRVIDIEELIKFFNSTLGRKYWKVVLTCGCFEILHSGHVKYLEKAKSLGNILVVAVNSDESVKQLKGRHKAIIPQKQRAEVVAALAVVDFVVIFNELRASEVVRKIKPDIFAKGGDRDVSSIAEYKEVIKSGGKVEVVGMFGDVSTTSIIDNILEKRMQMKCSKCFHLNRSLVPK